MTFTDCSSQQTSITHYKAESQPYDTSHSAILKHLEWASSIQLIISTELPRVRYRAWTLLFIKDEGWGWKYQVATVLQKNAPYLGFLNLKGTSIISRNVSWMSTRGVYLW